MKHEDNALLARAMGKGDDSTEWCKCNRGLYVNGILTCWHCAGIALPHYFTDPAACLELLEWARGQEWFREINIIGDNLQVSVSANMEMHEFGPLHFQSGEEAMKGFSGHGPFQTAFPAAVCAILREKEQS